MLLIGVAGSALSPRECEWLQNDAVAGVVLFKRNFVSRMQVTELSAAIRETAPRPQLIAVDQEGGRVQRFDEGFTALPPLRHFGRLYETDPEAALAQVRQHAWLMAQEIRATGLDLSFAPVVDLERGNRAIGDRSFSPDPTAVAAFVRAYIAGMHEAGMAATLKHFPGHGSVVTDTHLDTAIDPRPLATLRKQDLLPFRVGIEAGADAVMMAHVIYSEVSPEPAGFSRDWIEGILRQEMGFRGVVFSDDIGMAAAAAKGGVEFRVRAHLDAGCDVVLVCHPELVDDALLAMRGRRSNTAALLGLIGKGALGWDALLADPRRSEIQTLLNDMRHYC